MKGGEYIEVGLLDHSFYIQKVQHMYCLTETPTKSLKDFPLLIKPSIYRIAICLQRGWLYINLG